MNRLHVTSPQPVSLIYCVLNINLSSTYMLLVTALNIPQAYKSKAVSWTAAQQNSTAFLHAQPCSSLALYWTAEGLSTAHCPRGDSWCTLSCSPVALTDLRTELTRHRKTQRALAHVAFADTQPWPCQLWVAKAQPPASMENIPFSDVFNTEGGATIIVSRVQPSAVPTDDKCELERQLGKQKFRTGILKLTQKTAGRITDITPIRLAASPRLLLNIYRHTWPLAQKKKIHFAPDFLEGGCLGGRAGEGSALVSNENTQAEILV